MLLCLVCVNMLYRAAFSEFEQEAAASNLTSFYPEIRRLPNNDEQTSRASGPKDTSEPREDGFIRYRASRGRICWRGFRRRKFGFADQNDDEPKEMVGSVFTYSDASLFAR